VSPKAGTVKRLGAQKRSASQYPPGHVTGYVTGNGNGNGPGSEYMLA